MTAVLLSNVYSRTNHGDALLYDLTLDVLAEVGVAREDVTTWAHDPDSYRGDRCTVLPSVPATGRWARVQSVSRTMVRAYSHRPARSAAEFALVVACPGGYLNGRSFRQAAGFAHHHLDQLVRGAAAASRRIVMPVTVGPMVHPFLGATRAALADWDRVYVRDPDSEALLAGLGNVRRVPDLVALEIGRRRPDPALRVDPEQVRILLNARPVPHLGLAYVERIRQLRALLPETLVGSQAADDRPFLDRQGWPHEPYPDLLAGGPAVAVAVRLHAALMSVLAGVPAVHIAYDPKGFGAYGDLGLADFLFDGADFDPAEVAAAVLRLRADPAPFWAALDRVRPALRAARRELVADLDRLAH